MENSQPGSAIPLASQNQTLQNSNPAPEQSSQLAPEQSSQSSSQRTAQPASQQTAQPAPQHASSSPSQQTPVQQWQSIADEPIGRPDASAKHQPSQNADEKTSTGIPLEEQRGARQTEAWRTEEYKGMLMHVCSKPRAHQDDGLSGHGKEWDFVVRITRLAAVSTAPDADTALSDVNTYYSTQAIAENMGFLRGRELIDHRNPDLPAPNLPDLGRPGSREQDNRTL